MKKKEVRVSSEFKKENFLNWLNENGLGYTIDDDICVIDGEYGKWYVHMLLETRGKPTTMQTKLFNLIKTVDRLNVDKASILLEYNLVDTMTFKSISEYVRKNLNISLITVNAKGKVKEYM